MQGLRKFLRRLVRFIVVWLVDALSLGLTAWALPGINLAADPTTPAPVVATSAALVLGIVNLFVRPIILLLSLPFGFIAVFVVGFLVNAVTLMVTSWLLPAFEVNGWLAAFIGGLVFALVNTVVTNVVTITEQDSFYQRRIESLAQRKPFPNDGKRGLVMLEIDGLSYWHIQKAIEDGFMPALQAMQEVDGYVLTHIDCGLPSQTSACQCGIMFGDNHDIPAFRWLDKDKQKLYVSGHDAAEINGRYAHGSGLMRGGSSINNMMNGDAAKSLLTLADMRTAGKEEKAARAQDIYLLMLDPYFLMRALVLFFGDVIRELWEGWQQKRQNVYPRLNRTKHWYPFIRAATCSLMRDISGNLAILDIIRGSPAIYMTWPGYDEVAHHSGPWTGDAFKTLKQFDFLIERVREVIATKAPRPYDLIILSDHGQSFGATFLMRYGVSLKEFIEQHLPQGARVAHTTGGDDGALAVGALGDELANVAETGAGNTVGRAVAKQGQLLAQKGVEQQAQATADLGGTDMINHVRTSQVVVCGSGNIAQVYFDFFARKIKLSELESACPGLVDALVQHEGVGFVVGYADDGEPVVLGKQGRRYLQRDLVDGEDPLLPYTKEGVADAELRAEQLRRIADFPNADDLMVNSTHFADGTVAAMEELIGCHGGLGGEQTDAFIFHPADMQVPPTKNSADVFAILNARRALAAGAVPARPTPVSEEIDGWAPAAMAQGLGSVSLWLGRAGRALLLDSQAYRDIARDPTMNAPALLLALLFLTITSIGIDGQVDLVKIISRIGVWLLSVLAMFGAGRVLGGSGDFSATLRVMGFARAGAILELLAWVPVLAPLAHMLASLSVFFGAWIGAAQAHRLGGWRSLLLPVAASLVVTIGAWAIDVVVAGAEFTIHSLF
jgi:uncharacterized membrane protein YvlD (DUF360 family)